MRRLLLALLMSALGPPDGAWADAPDVAPAAPAAVEAETHTPAESDSEHDFHRNHIAVLVGGTIELDRHETLGGVTIGLDYERRLLRWLGIGGFVEYVAPEVDTFLVGGVVVFHPWRELKLSVGGGWEERFEHEESQGLVRVGAAYDFEVRGATIAPTVDVDVVRRNIAVVFGVAIGFGF